MNLSCFIINLLNNNIMKKLFLACFMLFFVGIASAQQTPAKTKQQKSPVDSTMQKGKTNKHTHKTDTISKQHKNKAGKKSTTTQPPTNSNRRDSVSSPTTPTSPTTPR